MNSRKEEERNERIIRGLMKLPPNRKCINCNSLGPQYVCTNFWTFVCIACSGIHREFTHRVKSVSMAKFTKEEVEALQRGGNQRARELFLKDWDIQRMRFPDSSNPDKIREFIKNVYVDKKYAGGNSSDKLPRDMQTLKNFEEDQRRASSYHSYSQSPPYENQYEERRYGKQCGALTRRPGSDRGLYERKISSFMYSPGHLREHAYEDRFANESTGPRISDYSVSSAGDPVRFDGQSSNFHATVYNSLPSQQVRDILIQDARTHIQHTHSLPNMKENFDQNPRSHRTMSSGSFGSFDSNSMSLKSVNSGSFADVLESEHPSRAQKMETLILPTSSQSSTSPCFVNHDLFSVPFVQPPMTTSAQPVDLFANINHQPSSTSPSEQILAEVSQPENEGWATFDIPHNVGHASERNDLKNARLPVKEGGHIESIDAFQPMHNKSQWFPLQSSAPVGPFQSIADQWHVGTHEVKKLSDAKDFKSWNAFDDLSTGNVSQSLFGCPLDNESQGPAHKPATSGDYVALEVPKDSVMNVFEKSTGDDMIPGFNTSFNDVTGSSFLSSILPLTEGNVQERKSTNPFDLPFDSDVESNNAFVDMSSLQAALPNPQLPPAFLGGLPEQYFPQSSVNAYISPVPQGLGLPYTEGQALSLQLPNVPQQGPVASLGGNPFA